MNLLRALEKWCYKTGGEFGCDQNGKFFARTPLFTSPNKGQYLFLEMLRATGCEITSGEANKMVLPERSFAHLVKHEMGHALCDFDLCLSGGRFGLDLADDRIMYRIGAHYQCCGYTAEDNERNLHSIVGSVFTDRMSKSDVQIYWSCLLYRWGVERTPEDVTIAEQQEVANRAIGLYKKRVRLLGL